MGSVANSTEMPSTWKDQFKRLFETNPEIRFIWKYDGKDVETPENVFVGKWVPQIDLLSESSTQSYSFLFTFRIRKSFSVFNAWWLQQFE